MKKEQSLQHLIVTEMPYELLKLLIEEKALSAFVRNLIKDTEVNSLSNSNYNKLRRTADLMENFPRNIILMAFVWHKTDEGNDFWSNLFKKAQLI